MLDCIQEAPPSTSKITFLYVRWKVFEGRTAYNSMLGNYYVEDHLEIGCMRMKVFIMTMCGDAFHMCNKGFEVGGFIW